MKMSVPGLVCCVFFLSGCSLINRLGYYRHEAAPRASPEEAETVRFPASFEKGIRMDGAMLSALHVAMNDFLPPGTSVNADDERIGRCLSKWSTYDTSMLQAGADLFFVSFIPDVSRCGLDAILMDAGGTYAVDAKGRILDVR
ncbi:hypothetical protein [Melittangium boletus]|uniref:hypothetical protein n=1 Tax=Melittangium boletus TaxID=83453 RepID=UPI003DA3AE3B